MKYTSEMIEAILPGVWDEQILLQARSPYAPAPDMPKSKSDPATAGNTLAMICDVQQAYRNAALSDRQKAAILLTYGMGHTLQFTASRMGCSASSVNNYRRDAIKAMLGYLN